MPSIAQIPVSGSTTSSPPGGKKRKREQLAFKSEDDYMKLGSIQYSSTLITSRSFFSVEPTDNTNSALPSAQPRLVFKPRSLKILRAHDTKRQRISFPEHEIQNLTPLEHRIYPDPYTTVSNTLSNNIPTFGRNYATLNNSTRPDLSPCHICHQKPKVRTDLNSYRDCEGCGKRTCHICMRECLGPSSPACEDGGWEKEEPRIDTDKDGMSFTTEPLTDETTKSEGIGDDAHRNIKQGYQGGETPVSWPSGGCVEWEHRGIICSQCCVERGIDGEVRCLGCLRAEKGG